MGDSTVKKLTVAVLGTGRMGDTHLAGLARLRDNGLKVEGQAVQIEPALYGRDPVNVQALAEKHGVNRTSSELNELIDSPEVDVVDNCLVNSLHYEPLMRALQRGKHVFAEKPLTVELGQAQRLLEAARAAGVHHGIVQNMRFNPGPAKAREIIAAGHVGRVFTARATFGYMVPQTITNRPSWFYKRELSGGGIVDDIMAHLFDLFRILVGPIDSVYAATRSAWPERRDPDGTSFKMEVEDIAEIVMKFANGALGNCHLSWVRRKHEEVPEFEIDGEEASLFFSFNRFRIQTREETAGFRFDARQAQTDADSGWQSIGLEPSDPYGIQLEQFLSGIVRGQPSKPDWEDALINLQLIAAAHRSAAEGREVSLHEMEEAR